jgi:hypothetical protein
MLILLSSNAKLWCLVDKQVAYCLYPDAISEEKSLKFANTAESIVWRVIHTPALAFDFMHWSLTFGGPLAKTKWECRSWKFLKSNASSLHSEAFKFVLRFVLTVLVFQIKIRKTHIKYKLYLAYQKDVQHVRQYVTWKELMSINANRL